MRNAADSTLVGQEASDRLFRPEIACVVGHAQTSLGLE